MKLSIWVTAWLSAIALIGGGCETVHKAHPTTVWHEMRVRDEGYSLLYELVGQEADVDKLLIIKHADSSITDLIKEIAGVSREAKKQLEQFNKQDPHLNLKMTDLPQIEQKTREAIASTSAKQLLFSSGKVFESRLIFTQLQAMNYGSHMATVLAGQEKDPARKKFLTDLAPQFLKFYDRLFELVK